jgi:hypothetical protein
MPLENVGKKCDIRRFLLILLLFPNQTPELMLDLISVQWQKFYVKFSYPISIPESTSQNLSITRHPSWAMSCHVSRALHNIMRRHLMCMLYMMQQSYSAVWRHSRSFVGGPPYSPKWLKRMIWNCFPWVTRLVADSLRWFVDCGVLSALRLFLREKNGGDQIFEIGLGCQSGAVLRSMFEVNISASWGRGFDSQSNPCIPHVMVSEWLSLTV